MQKEAIINAYLWNPVAAPPASEDEDNRERKSLNGAQSIFVVLDELFF